MKILIIGMADSVHLARWLSQFRDSGHIFEVVSSSPHRRIHPVLSDLLALDGKYQMHWISRYLSLPLWIADRLFSDWLRGLLVAWRATRFRPNLVHVLEFQNGGYSYLRARSITPALEAPLLLTPYGSDMFWFQKYENHLVKIRKLLALASGVSSECKRDEMLAAKYGFKGKFGPRIPASGAMVLDRSRMDNTDRFRITVKGYQNKWGQALTALECLEEMQHELSQFEITLFSCNRSTLKRAKELAKKTDLKITAFPKGGLSNQQVHQLMSESIALIALSTSDGVPASMLEAMANGAIPIQSDTSCCDEWLTSGQGGFLVPWSDKEVIKDRLRLVLTDEDFRNKAIRINFKKLQDSIDGPAAHKAASATYEMFI